MHPARLVPAVALAALGAIATVACTSGQAPGWTYAPPPSASVVPSLAPSASVAPGSAAPGSAAPGSTAPGSAAPGSAAPGSAAPSTGTGGTLLTEVASGIRFESTTLEAPAGQPFQIEFDNRDAGIPHNIGIQDGSGALLFEGESITGVAKTTYSVPALAAGTYPFMCKWHPNMTGQLTAR